MTDTFIGGGKTMNDSILNNIEPAIFEKVQRLRLIDKEYDTIRL